MKYIVFLFVIVSCSQPAAVVQDKIGKIKRIAILGNSIVRHVPLPEIGWNNNWGMAASSIDSDYVHILRADLEPQGIRVMAENIADFEKNYTTWDLHKVDSFRSFKPDIIVMDIAENVTDSLAVSQAFITHYDKLIKYLDSSGTAVKIICNGWWKNKHVNKLLKEYARNHGYHFVDQSASYSEDTRAKGLYKDEGVQQHPNNAGMKVIAASIMEEIRPYLK